MQTISFKITGTSPLIQANPQTVNPFNKYTKELSTLTSKRKKTEDDLMEISHIKFIASLYYDKDKGYLIPASHFWKSKTKLTTKHSPHFPQNQRHSPIPF